MKIKLTFYLFIVHYANELSQLEIFKKTLNSIARLYDHFFLNNLSTTKSIPIKKKTTTQSIKITQMIALIHLYNMKD